MAALDLIHWYDWNVLWLAIYIAAFGLSLAIYGVWLVVTIRAGKIG